MVFIKLITGNINMDSAFTILQSQGWVPFTKNEAKSNTHQIQTLTQLCDALLPKLMSGEVRVKK